MTETSGGWEPLRKPDRRTRPGPGPRRERPVHNRIGHGLLVTSFTKLARVQSLSSFGDGFIAVALAGSIFFSIEPSDARWRVALYLLLTIAPFAVVTPLLGPAIDRARGGRRGMVIGSLAGRAVIAFLMVRHIDSLLLFPEAFVMLILQKGYFVSRTALVPAVVEEDELIEANSKLSLISAFSGVFGGAIAAFLVFLFDNGSIATGVATAVFLAGAAAATQLPQVAIADKPVDETERHEVRGANILLAASAMGVVRGIVGFTTFLLAFHLRAGGTEVDRSGPGAAVGASVGTARGLDVTNLNAPPQWHFGAAGLAVGIGAFLGARYAPRLRETVPEERILLAALGSLATLAFLGAWGGGISGTVLLSFGVGISAAVAKLGFDALVQRDAPLANHGRQFARFEARFQLMWALGAFIPVIIPLGIRLGAAFIAMAAAFAAISYEVGRRSPQARRTARVREVIADRIPAGTGARLRFSRLMGTGPAALAPASAPIDVEESTATVDPTSVAPVPPPTDQPPAPPVGAAPTSVPIDSIWSDLESPHVSAGTGVWVEPDDPGADPTVDMPRDPDEQGQYRLWPDED